MSVTRYPTPAEVAAGIVDGVRKDETLGCVADADAELRERITHVIEGEREMARRWFDFYSIPLDGGEP